MAQVLQAGDLFEPQQQALFLFPGEPQDALVGHGVGEQGIVLTDAGARRAGDSDRNLNGKAHRCPGKIRPGRDGAGHASSRLQRGQGESPGQRLQSPRCRLCHSLVKRTRLPGQMLISESARLAGPKRSSRRFCANDHRG